jgi:cation-transporting ATPase I
VTTALATPTLDDKPPVLVLSTVQGRLRAHLADWGGKGAQQVQAQLRSLIGVRSARANPLTGNILIHYDRALTDETTLLGALRALRERIADIEASGEPAAKQPPAHVQRDGQTVHARIAVRGMDRNPHLARRVVERLERFPGVRAIASPLTGRVLVEFESVEVQLDDLLTAVANVEMPDLPEEDYPADPLDPAPYVQSLVRTVGSALGLAVLGVQHILGASGPLAESRVPANVSGIIALMRGFPLLRNGLRAILGRNVADLALSLPNIATLALVNSPLGLAVSGAESATLLREVRMRQAAWRQYTENLQNAAAATPGAVLRLESGEMTSLSAEVLEGFGTFTDRSGRPIPVSPGVVVPPGSRLFGGPFLLRMVAVEGFAAQTRPAPFTPTLYDRYTRIIAPVSLGYALLTAILTRSLSRTFAALLLVNPRVALIASEMASLDANTRVLKAGVVVTGTRQDRTVRRPDTVLVDGPRLIADRFEVANVVSLDSDLETPELIALAGSVAVAAGSPWGGAFRTAADMAASDGHFDGSSARATVRGSIYALSPIDDYTALPEASLLRQRGNHVLKLTRGQDALPIGLFALRVGISATARSLIEVCRRHRVLLALLPGHDALTARAIAARTGISILDSDDALGAIQSRQALGQYVAYISDGAHAGMAFDACDLAIGLTDGRTPLAARVDLIAPDLAAIAAIVEAGARRDGVTRDSVGLSMLANIAGAVWGFQGAPGVERASTFVYWGALAAIADGWWRLRGGERAHHGIGKVVDPRPERWGARTVESVLAELHASEDGLSTEEARGRHHIPPTALRRQSFLASVFDQLRTPLTTILAAGAGISLLLGGPGDVAIIGLTLGANALIAAWQEQRAGRVVETLHQMGAVNARVLRDGRPVVIPAGQIVPGDILLLAPGDRITADARLLSAQSLEVDEAALTGESFPVQKWQDGSSDVGRIVLDGSDVTSGTGRAVAFAVGRDTRMGSIAAALSMIEKDSPLDRRLSQLLGQLLPLAIAGGVLVTGAGWLRTRALLPQLAIGATIALAAMPEGLPLLTRISEAGVARRLASRNSLVKRLPAVEALGRVDVACTDKTGTLTQGTLRVSLVAEAHAGESSEMRLPPSRGRALSDDLRGIILAAALASPHPDEAGAKAHPTDVAVITGAEEAGLGKEIRVARSRQLPFDSARAFHSAVVGDRLLVKGAPEHLIARCVSERQSSSMTHGHDEPLDAVGRRRLVQRAEALAAQGLRVLMVAERSGVAHTEAQSALEDPQRLVALGFIGISDPLRPTVQTAVRRCREAGIQVIMLTGDHPSTARVIAREAGLLSGVERDDMVLTGAQIGRLEDNALDAVLARAVVIARATPLDKVRIIDSLKRSGRTVAMTGDGVNDAPALRLADVGFAMGRGGTEVARQAADVVVADDDFSTLVEALVEGRSFWRNIRSALGLLLGGNLGELGLVVGATMVGLASPLNARQILVVNMITDILPGLAVALQQPAHRNLRGLAREGASALDKPLTNEIIRRGALTAGPSLVAYALTASSGGRQQAQTVAFASVVGSQLAQTLDAGSSEGRVTTPVLAAIAGSGGLTVGAIIVPPLRRFLGLALPGPIGWGLISASMASAYALSRGLSTRQ